MDASQSRDHRLVAYSRLTVITFAALMTVSILKPLPGTRFGVDFLAFWSAGHLALSGEPEAAYDMDRLLDASQLAIPGNTDVFVFSYPPTFLVALMPLSALPYAAALALWSLIGIGIFTWSMRRLSHRLATPWMILAFPGVFLNLVQGQNGLITAGLLGLGLSDLEERPIRAGVWFGILAFKPQIAVLIPLALIAGRAWRALTSSVLVGATSLFLSWILTSWSTFERALSSLSLAVSLLEAGRLRWDKMPTAFASAFSLGASIDTAHVIHLIIAALALLVTAYHWHRFGFNRPTGAMLATATLLTSPYLTDHDLAILAIPIVLLTIEGTKSGWLRFERALLTAAWLAPILDAPLSRVILLHPAVVVNIALVALAFARLRRVSRPAAP